MSPIPEPPVATPTVPAEGERVASEGGRLPAEGGRVARAFEVDGVVQGVGFRPFVYRLARDLGLDGRVRNAAGRVEIEAAGESHALDQMATRLVSNAPPRAHVERVAVRALAGPEADVDSLRPGAGFSIEESVAAPSAVRLFPPDIATCDDCLRELFDPADRRYRYPFINCTNCGPRATIIDELPYDRARTSMRDFPLCSPCQAEYRDPGDRRFHAEPVACAACGPRLAFRRPGDAAPMAHEEAALAAAVSEIRAGRIVAIKGLGGYHLACDATDEVAVGRLRDRKRRWAKPFAVMVRDLDGARAMGRVTPAEERLLTSPARPIVLVEARAHGDGATLAASVTRGNRRVGIFLPYTPLHHLLLEAVARPIVLTSGNLSDEPLVTDDEEALVRLAGLADSFLQHDRRIRARYDDSVTRAVGETADAPESVIRRGRGYAPEPVRLPVAVPAETVLLAVGAELKHTFTLASTDRAHVAPHIGDLEDLLTHRAFEENLAHLARLLALDPQTAVHDLHPGYLSTQYAVGRFAPARRIAVQHHHAHVASAAAEHGVTGPFIGVAYDGLGMGDDGTFWGGEILVGDLARYRRVGRFAYAPMPGGALAVRKPYRMALGYLLGSERLDGGEPIDRDLAHVFLARLDPREVDVVGVQLARRLNAPVASSAGRLFDAASSMLGLRDVAEYEAQAAIDLEMAADGARHGPLPYRLVERDGLLVYDPRPTLGALLEGGRDALSVAVLAARFQETIAEVTRELCSSAARTSGIRTICLSGGVFQNAWLAASVVDGLTRDGFEVFMNQRVPANDGGISYGQAAVAAARLAGMGGGRRGTAPAGPAIGG
ncbi:MAG TPA: carbamoyltransferase HypF [Candidatus Limnocylindrales bacterium]